MIRVSTFCAILAFLTYAQAFADESVVLRSDGKVIDAEGNILAVPNTADPRNTDYDKYYLKVGPNGKLGTASDFYVTADLENGFVKKEINPPAAANVGSKPAALEQTAVTNPAATSIQLYKHPDQPIYDNLQNSGAIYGN